MRSRCIKENGSRAIHARMPLTLDDVPPFVCYHIAAYLTLGEMSALRAVNRRWQRMVDDGACWTVRCAMRYPKLLRRFAEWSGDTPANQHKHVGALLRQYARSHAGNARLVLVNTHLSALQDLDQLDRCVTLLVKVSVLRRLQFFGVALAVQWNDNARLLCNLGRGIVIRRRCSVLFLLPESVCRLLPNLHCREAQRTALPSLGTRMCTTLSEIPNTGGTKKGNMLVLSMSKVDVSYASPDNVRIRHVEVA